MGEADKAEEDPCCPMKMKTGKPKQDLWSIKQYNHLLISIWITIFIVGVQILGGILAIISGVILVLFFAKLDELISKRYVTIFEVLQQREVFYQNSFNFQSEIARGTLTWMAGLIVLAILVNILMILGGSGGRWRRGLLLPWLIFYGFGIVGCFVTHIYFTSLCWREEKMD